MANNDLKVNLIGDASKLTASLNKATSKLSAFSKKAKDVGKNLSLKLTLPIALAAGAAIKLASDFDEAMNKVDVSFGKSSKSVKKFAETTLNNFGIAEGSALDMAAMFGDMGTSMGITQKAAAAMSISMVGLAGDLASFKNIGIDQATTALAGVFTGETESLKKLGIIMTEATLKQFALNQGIRTSIKDMSQAAKVSLRYAYILSVTENSQGDYVNTQKLAANQMKTFGQGMKEVGVALGQILLPAFTKIMLFLNELISKFLALDDKTKKIIVGVALFAAAIGPLIFAIGSLASISGIMATGFGVLSTATLALKGGFISLTTAMMANPFIAIGVALVALTGYVVTQAQKMTPLVSKWNTLVNLFKSGGNMTKFATLQFIDQAAAQKEAALAAGENGEATEKETGKIDELKQALLALNGELEKTSTLKKKVSSVSAFENEDPKKSINYNTGKMDNMGDLGLVSTNADPIKLLADSVSTSNGVLTENLNITKGILTQKGLELQEATLQLNESMSSIMQSGMVNIATGIGEALGAAISGSASLVEGLSSVLLGGIGAMVSQLGQLLIQTGIGLLAIKKSLETINPYLAIAAGIALVALGAAFAAGSKKIASGGGGGGGPTKFANGGIVSSPTLGLMGEYPGAKSNPEVIAPLDKLKNMIGDRGGSNVQVAGEFVLKGQDLIVALQRANNNRNRII